MPHEGLAWSAVVGRAQGVTDLRGYRGVQTGHGLAGVAPCRYPIVSSSTRPTRVDRHPQTPPVDHHRHHYPGHLLHLPLLVPPDPAAHGQSPGPHRTDPDVLDRVEHPAGSTRVNLETERRSPRRSRWPPITVVFGRLGTAEEPGRRSFDSSRAWLRSPPWTLTHGEKPVDLGPVLHSIHPSLFSPGLDRGSIESCS